MKRRSKNRLLFGGLTVVLILLICFIFYGISILFDSSTINAEQIYIKPADIPECNFIIKPQSGDIQKILEELPQIEETVTDEPEYIGVFRLTGYCPCEICCGAYADGITATGTVATANRTIAVDPKVIPLGSHVIINGIEYIAEDTGSAINEKRIDIFCNTHGECFSSFCNGYADVYLVKGEK